MEESLNSSQNVQYSILTQINPTYVVLLHTCSKNSHQQRTQMLTSTWIPRAIVREPELGGQHLLATMDSDLRMEVL